MIDRFRLETVAAAVVGLLGAAAATAAATSAEVNARAQAVNRKILNLDAHADVLLPSTPRRYWGAGHTSRTALDKVARGSVDVLTLSIAVGPGPRTPEGLAEARKEAEAKLQAIRTFVNDSAGRAELALTAADVERIVKQGRVAVIESFQNARSLGKDVGAIDGLYKNGMRVFALTHAGNNDFADSSRPQPGEGEEHRGLSPLGKQAVTKLNQLGVIVDISQLTPAGVFQVLELTKAPVIATHSNVRALVDNTRNLSDKELDAIKANRGVVSVTPFNAYLAKVPAGFAEKAVSLRKQYGLPAQFEGQAFYDGYDRLPQAQQDAFLNAIQAIYPKASVVDYVDHIDYLVKRIGIDHVGIGTDFNHGAGVTGFDDESEAANVTAELLQRGYKEDQIAKIWGGNFLRVFREVEAAAKRPRAS